MGDDLGVKLKLRRKITGILADARRLVKLFRLSTERNLKKALNTIFNVLKVMKPTEIVVLELSFGESDDFWHH
jgi:hypothetical protein